MERRAFLKCSGTICSGVLLSSLVGSSIISSCGLSSKIIKVKSEQNKVQLELAEFDDEKFKIIRVASYDFDLGIQKMSSNEYRVLLLLCPHANQPVTKSGDGFVCTMHGSRFRADGSVTKGPSSDPMPILKYEINQGQIIIDLPKF